MKSFLGVSLCLVLAQAAPVPTVEVRPSTANVSIGERFQVTLEASGPEGTTYEFPGQVADGPVELTLARPQPGRAGVAVYEAQSFALGKEAQIPAVSVTFRQADGTSGVLKTTPVPLNVISSLDPKESNPAPADFAPPVPVLVSRAFWVASGLAGLLLVAAAALLFRRLRFPKKVVSPRVTPAASPEEEAILGLDRLAAERPALDPRIFYIRLVQILKAFLERRLQAPVLEMTSTETLSLVKVHDWTAPQAVSLRGLVTSADRVKFAGSSDASQGEAHIQIVRDVVRGVDRMRRAERAAAAPDQEAPDGEKSA